jgi:RiboL-PSP-HEPN
MPEETVVDRLYREFSRLTSYLLEAKEQSLEITANEQCRKALLLAAASYFEDEVTKIVTSWVAALRPHNQQVEHWVRSKGIELCYHKWFKWERRDGKAFDGLLGTLFKDYMREQVQADIDLETALRDFLEIGESRNRLVHQNFGSFTLEKTTDEIYQLFNSARRFPPLLNQKLLDFCKLEPSQE